MGKLKVKSHPKNSAHRKEVTSLRVENDFESAGFCEVLHDILRNQERTKRKDVIKGDDYIYFDAWRVPYRAEGKITHEIYRDIMIGSVESSNPLTFSEAIRLNTYNGALSCNRGYIVSCDELIPVNHKLFQRLKRVLNTKGWAKDLSYNKKYITVFVQSLENYFMGGMGRHLV